MDQHIKNLVWLACAGLSGSFVGMRLQKTTKKKPRTLWDNVSYVINGLLVAFFFTPFLCKWFHVADIEDVRAVAFFTGAFWSKILERYGADFSKNKQTGSN
ncbi:hypothetical protein QMM96_22295 [Citrobacter freundii]|uniref:hypothetical protein n=1 Tax=Citrobacter freundii TaxID=546 RepID=UPI001A1DF307|nr:hypothetical protein [Citrobacter freundii]MEB2478163.1 hypothetical protein [Citrobacter freundii]HAT3959805.1 hypothetical protein [Citrobacter freundii]HAT3963919.1 hypothetical protein [Citrobacter freundii]